MYFIGLNYCKVKIMNILTKINKVWLGRITLVLTFSFISNGTFAQPNWTFSTSAVNHTILIQDIIPLTINGNQITSGDYIGVFFDSTYGAGCGGYIEWNGSNSAITAWGMDVGGDGFIDGESFKWKIWQASTNLEFDAVPTYNTNTTEFPDLGFFAGNGMSALTSLVVNCNSMIAGYISTGTKQLVYSAIVVLYEITNNGYKAIDYFYSNDGHYSFVNMENANYIVHAIPNFEMFSYLPVYNGNNRSWEQANIITIDNSLHGIDINLPPTSLNANGIASISGTVFFDHDSIYESAIFENNWFGGGSKNTSQSIAARNITVFLLDDLGNPISCTLTNIDGSYQFENLPYNLYYIKVEHAGFSSENAEIILYETEPDVDSISFTLIKDKIVQDIGTISNSEDQGFFMYPNPVNDILNINFSISENAKIRLSIFNCIGNEIFTESYQKTKGEYSIKKNVEALSNGIYFVKLEKNNKVLSFGKFIK